MCVCVYVCVCVCVCVNTWCVRVLRKRQRATAEPGVILCRTIIFFHIGLLDCFRILFFGFVYLLYLHIGYIYFYIWTCSYSKMWIFYLTMYIYLWLHAYLNMYLQTLMNNCTFREGTYSAWAWPICHMYMCVWIHTYLNTLHIFLWPGFVYIRYMQLRVYTCIYICIYIWQLYIPSIHQYTYLPQRISHCVFGFISLLCKNIYTHTYIYVYIINKDVCIYLYDYINTHIYIYTHLHIYMYIHICIYIYVLIDLHTYAHTHTRTHTHTHTKRHIQTHKNTYTYTWERARENERKREKRHKRDIARQRKRERKRGKRKGETHNALRVQKKKTALRTDDMHECDVSRIWPFPRIGSRLYILDICVDVRVRVHVNESVCACVCVRIRECVRVCEW